MYPMVLQAKPVGRVHTTKKVEIGSREDVFAQCFGSPKRMQSFLTDSLNVSALGHAKIFLQCMSWREQATKLNKLSHTSFAYEVAGSIVTSFPHINALPGQNRGLSVATAVSYNRIN